MKCLFLIAFVIFQAIFCQGQDTYLTLTGKVTDAQTGQPLPLAFVFLNNSTLAAQTDEHGNFKLGNLPLGDLDIRVSLVGYEPLKETLRYEQAGTRTVSFQMKQGIDLNDVVIKGKKDKRREEQLKIMTIELLGESPFRKQCSVINPEVLRIYDDDEGHLRAKSAEPLVIENRGLGYRIFQNIEDFNYFGGMVYYGGSTRFEDLKPKDDAEEVRWVENRKRAYQGSLKHLLVSMVTDQMAREGFHIYQQLDPLAKPVISFQTRRLKITDPETNLTEKKSSDFIRPGMLESERIFNSDELVEVFFTKKKGRSPYSDMPYAYSRIVLPQKQFLFTVQGWIARPMGLTVEGDLSFDRLSTLLPADWEDR